MNGENRRPGQGERPTQQEEPFDEQHRPLPQPPPAGGLPSYEGGTGSMQRQGASQELETSDWIAVIASLIPGVGQLILGQTVKGLVILGISIVLCAGGGIFSVASMIDTYLVARARKNRAVGDWEFFPDFQQTFNPSS